MIFCVIISSFCESVCWLRRSSSLVRIKVSTKVPGLIGEGIVGLFVHAEGVSALDDHMEATHIDRDGYLRFDWPLGQAHAARPFFIPVGDERKRFVGKEVHGLCVLETKQI